MKHHIAVPLTVFVVVALGLYAGISVFLKNGQTSTPTSTDVSSTTPPLVIDSFQSCSTRYPVLESYPEQCNTPTGEHFVQDIGNALELNDRIVNSFPQPDTLIQSPLSIEGEARGNWYFEASFPVKIVDATGSIVAQGVAHALENWMTTEFVPYQVTLTFTPPSSSDTGTLILTRDDPSGVRTPEELHIPIHFR